MIVIPPLPIKEGKTFAKHAKGDKNCLALQKFTLITFGKGS